MMSAGTMFVVWKGLLGFALPIAVGLWELHRLRKYRDADAAALRAQDAAPPTGEAKPAPARVLEAA